MLQSEAVDGKSFPEYVPAAHVTTADDDAAALHVPEQSIGYFAPELQV
jgi:hypothetical protein